MLTYAGAALNRPCVTGSPPRISPKMKAKLMEALQGAHLCLNGHCFDTRSLPV